MGFCSCAFAACYLLLAGLVVADDDGSGSAFVCHGEVL